MACRLPGLSIMANLENQAAKSLKRDKYWPPTNGEVHAYLESPPPELFWLVRNQLLADRAHLLTGVGGSSKTRFLYHLAIGVAIGRLPWSWEITQTGKAALFLAEDNSGQVHRTLASLVEHGGLSPDEITKVKEGLKVFPLAGEGSQLLSFETSKELCKNERFDDLLSTCKDIKDLKFIGLDPALALTEGDEMNPTHQRRLGEMADHLAMELSACVVLASHAAKASQNASEITSHSSRGSGAITDAVRAEFVLRSMNSYEAKKLGVHDVEARRSFVQLVPTKGNELPSTSFQPIWLQRGTAGLLTEVSLTESTCDSGPRTKDLAALEVMRELAFESSGVKTGDWLNHCIAKNVVPKDSSAAAQEKFIQRIRKTLLEANYIKEVKRGIYLPTEVLPDKFD